MAGLVRQCRGHSRYLPQPAGAGRPAGSRGCRTAERVLSGQVFCDAWTFDSFWLHRLFRAAGETPEFQLESVSMLLNPAQVRQWSGTRQQVIADLGLPVHRAANDALILHKTWERVICLGEAAVR